MRFHFIGSVAKKDSYIVLGDWYEISCSIDFLRGARRIVERMLLRARASFPVVANIDFNSDLEEAVLNLDGSLSPKDAFLLNTSWYKGTNFVGAMRNENSQVTFVRSFKVFGGGDLEAERYLNASREFGEHFRVPRLIFSGSRLIEYELIEHGKEPRLFSNGVFEAMLRKIEMESLAGFNSRRVEDCLDCDLYERLAARFIEEEAVSTDNCSFLSESSRSELLDVAIAHGDFVPWNTFVDNSGNFCLIDFDEVGEKPAYYDLYHFLVQPLCMRRRLFNSSLRVEDIFGSAEASGFIQKVGRRRAERYFRYYLITSTLLALQAWFSGGYKHWRLKAAIVLRLGLLMQLRPLDH